MIFSLSMSWILYLWVLHILRCNGTNYQVPRAACGIYIYIRAVQEWYIMIVISKTILADDYYEYVTYGYYGQDVYVNKYS